MNIYLNCFCQICGLHLIQYYKITSENNSFSFQNTHQINNQKLKFYQNYQMSVIIKPLSADLIKGHDFLFLKKSPYVSIQLGGESYRTFPDKRGGKTPQWSEAFVFNNLAPSFKVTLLSQLPVGQDAVLGEGQFNLAPAYSNPNIADRRYIDIYKNGNIVAKVLCSIQYKGNSAGYGMNANMNMNNMNNMNMNSNIEQMNQTISSAIGNTVMQSVNANNSSNMNMNLNSENENRQSKIIEVPVPVPVFVNPIIEMPRVPLSVVNTPIITSTPTTVYVQQRIRAPTITTTTYSRIT